MESAGKRAARREALLNAAAELFFEFGYAATSIDAIIALTGGSKRNIYSVFGGKEGLFTALVERAGGAAAVELASGDIEAIADWRSALVEAAQRLIAAFVSPSLVGVYRIMVAEGARFPELARRAYEQGPERAGIAIARVLKIGQQRGELPDMDLNSAANLFVAMTRNNLHLQVVLGLRAAPDEIEIALIAAETVDVFLDGVAALGDRRALV